MRKIVMLFLWNVFVSCVGQYLLDNDILCYVGKVVEKAADHDSDDDYLDEPGSGLIIPGRKARAEINKMPLAASLGKWKKYISPRIRSNVSSIASCNEAYISTSATIRGPLTNQVHLIYPIHQSHAFWLSEWKVVV